MENLKSVDGNMKSTEVKKVSYSYSKGDIKRTIEVLEVENGFIIKVDEDGVKYNDKGDKDYYYACKKYISKTNPLEDGKEGAEAMKPLNTVIQDALNNLTL